MAGGVSAAGGVSVAGANGGATRVPYAGSGVSTSGGVSAGEARIASAGGGACDNKLGSKLQTFTEDDSQEEEKYNAATCRVADEYDNNILTDMEDRQGSMADDIEDDDFYKKIMDSIMADNNDISDFVDVDKMEEVDYGSIPMLI